MAFERTVLQVIPALNAGGAERTTVEIARAINNAGGRALVASSGGRLEAEIEAAGGTIFRLAVHSKNPLIMARNAMALKELIRRESVDLVHVRSRAPAWSALWAGRATGTPVAATYHGAYEARTAFKRFYNSGMVRADLVIANSDFTAAAVRALYPKVAMKLVTIPRGADLSVFNPEGVSQSRVASLAKSWDVAVKNGVKLLLPGRLTSWKGQAVAIEAIARLTASSSDATRQPVNFQLILAGDSQGHAEYERSLRDLIEQRGVRHMINLVGHCADMPAAYAWADAVLAPSTRPEAFGRVAVEAAAMGRCVIASDHGGARGVIMNGETGFLVEPGSAPALTDAIDRAASMGVGGRAAIGARARARASEHFSVDAMCRSTLDAYRTLLDA